MKKLMLLPINVVLEYFRDKVEAFLHRKQKPTLLAISIDVFNNESWIDGILRQKRLMDYLYYYNEQSTVK